MSFSYTKELLDNALTYDEYRQHITTILAKAPVTEREQKMAPYYAKHGHLMDRFIASYKVNNLMLEALRIARPVTWLVITEGWCQDAAYIAPMLHLIEKAAHGKIELKFVLMDEHPELMDANLTNGARSIPKLIVLNEYLEDIATWGPRPEALETQIAVWKSTGCEKRELIAHTDNWYGEDHTLELQHELRDLIYRYSGRKQSIERLENLNRMMSFI